MAELAKLAQIGYLFVDLGPITDTGLVHLYKLTELKQLWLDDTAVTQMSVDALQRRLPGYKIRWTAPAP